MQYTLNHVQVNQPNTEEHMNTSESTTKIAPALAKALGEIANATKDAKNPHFKSTYATLAAVIDATKSTLHAHGLVVIQAPGWHESRVTVTTRIMHESGEWIESVAETPIPKQDAQAVGSAVTYLRRYSLAALCGITQEDDDGNAAANRAPRQAPRKASGNSAARLVTLLGQAIELGLMDEKQATHVRAAANSNDVDMIERATRYVEEKIAS